MPADHDAAFVWRPPSRSHCGRLSAAERDELAACTRVVVKFCIEHHGVRDDTKFREDQEKLLLAKLDLSRIGTERVAAAEDTDSTVSESFRGRRQSIAEFRFRDDAVEGTVSVEYCRMHGKRMLLRWQLLEFVREQVEEGVLVDEADRELMQRVYEQGLELGGDGVGAEAEEEEGVIEERLVKIVSAMEKRRMANAKIAVQQTLLNAQPQSRQRRRFGAGMDQDEAYSEEGDRKRSRKKSEGKDSTTLGTRWSKKDRAEFIKVVNHYGIVEGEWRVFSQLGDFAPSVRSQRAFDEYAEVFQRACRASAERRSTRGRLRKGGGVEEAEPSSDDEAYFKDEGLFIIPTERAKRALERIALFARVRAVCELDDEALGELLGRARRTMALPKWWQCGAHDVAFLRAVAKYGIGRVECVVADPALPFRALYEEQVGVVDVVDVAEQEVLEQREVEESGSAKRGRRKAKESVLEIDREHRLALADVDAARFGWMAEQVALRRAEYLCEMVENRRTRDATAAASAAAGSESLNGVGRKRKKRVAEEGERMTVVATLGKRRVCGDKRVSLRRARLCSRSRKGPKTPRGKGVVMGSSE